METCGLNSFSVYLILRVLLAQAGPGSKSELSSGSWLTGFISYHFKVGVRSRVTLVRISLIGADD